uniref:Ribosomal RNA large subunit methyltransferase K/L-like methyltransferase domain-containing protein n=1 Tax=Monopterus albus TaxID=43700 RepID=A0A3Q3R9G4_MONAL
MTEPRSEGGLLCYYCTAGKGMEPFLMEEVKRKLAAENVRQIPGKVLFSSPMTIDRVSELKAAERLFLLVKQEPPVRLSAHTNPGATKAASVLQSRLLGDKNQWTRAALTWSRLQGELEQKKNRITSREEEDEQGMETRKRTGEQREEENGNRSLGTRAQTVEKKRKREKEEREVNVYLSDDHCLLGIPLTRLPLANRSYIKTTGLRSTVAWAMASLAQIQVLRHTTAAVFFIYSATCFLGMDIDDGQLQKANDNVEFAELGNRIHLLKASSVVLPLPSGSVDAVVCDLPFGRKFGTKTDMAAKLPAIVNEMERVLSIGGTLVLLLSPQLSYLLKELLAQKHTGPTSNQGTNFQIHYGVQPSYTRETDELCHGPLPPLSSLKHQATLRVSLGAIDGLIHKYVKIVA